MNRRTVLAGLGALVTSGFLRPASANMILAPPPVAAATHIQAFVPGQGFIAETATRQAFIPGLGFICETH